MQPLILESRRDLPLLLTVSTKRRKSIPQYTGGDPPLPHTFGGDFPAIRIIFDGNLNKIGTFIRSPVFDMSRNISKTGNRADSIVLILIRLHTVAI